MINYLFEIFPIVAFSKRIQWALLFGVIGFFGIKLLGHHIVNDFEISGILAPLTEVIQFRIGQRYDDAAFACLFSSLTMAVRFYRKDRKRFYRY